MIKWAGFGKSLKQLFIILLISCFIYGVNSSVNAVDLHKVGSLTTFNNMEVGVISKGSFITQRLGTGKPIFAFISNSTSDSNYQYIYLFWKNGLPYFYNSYTCVGNCSQGNKFSQGFISRYQVCNELLEGDNAVSNCSWVSVGDGTVAGLRNFLSSVNTSDYYLFDLVNYTYGYANAKVCISSHSLQQSVCFVDEGISVLSPGNLTGSIGIPSKTDFQNLLSYYYDNSSPAIQSSQNGSFGGGGGISATFSSGGNITLSCNNRYVYNYYKNNGYTKNLCYGGLNNFDLTGDSLAIPGDGLDLFEIYSGTANICGNGDYCVDNGIDSWFKYWNIVYDNLQRGIDYGGNNFNNTPMVIQSYFGFVNQYGKSFKNKDIIEYCSLELGKLPLLDSYTGVNKDSICSSLSVGVSYEDGNGNVIVGNDVLGAGSGLTTYRDGSVFVDDSINTIKSYWRIPNKSDFGLGYLPQYILSFLCLIIVFRFISH